MHDLHEYRQPRFYEPLYNEVLDMTNDVLQPEQTKLQ